MRERAGFALMKMVGTLGSFLGPALIGALADATGGFAAPCLVLGVCLAAGAVLMLAFRAPSAPPPASAQRAWAACKHRGFRSLLMLATSGGFLAQGRILHSRCIRSLDGPSDIQHIKEKDNEDCLQLEQWCSPLCAGTGFQRCTLSPTGLH